MVARMNRSDAFGRAISTSGQVFLAAISLQCYNQPPDRVDTDRLVRELEPKYTPIPPMADTHMQASFEHLNGYSAIYYTYQWSLVISKDLLSRFDRTNLLDPKPARRYRDIVLAPGGSRPARDVVHEFLGRDYDFKAYDAWLAGRG
jgi:thimet oligopeptidase